MAKTYELWEIMKDGKDGEVFEVCSCSIPNYLGKQIQVYEVKEEAGHFKALIEPNANFSSETFEATPIKMYGCLGTATFKKVESYKKITFEQAFKRLSQGMGVYVGTASGGMQRMSPNTMLKLVDIYTVFEVLEANYFIKGNEVDV